MTSYYYPSTYGAAQFVSSGSASGEATFTANYQAPADTYTVITSLPGTSPQQYAVTTGYTGPGTGLTFTVTQTPYSDANHNETYGVVPGVGPAYLILTNGPILTPYTYTFSGTSAPFQPSPGSTTDPTLCFVGGTKIRTHRGDVPVEALRVGDRAVTESGALRPIIWIGHRHLDGEGAVLSFDQCPIRVRTGAFGDNLPEDDLWLSPGHPVLVGAVQDDGEGCEGHLVPIMCLINGTTIERVAVDAVTYWHIELDAHDIVLAEGLPAESYIDLGSRAWFGGADGALHDPDGVLPGMPGRCRPVAIDGPVVDAQRRRLDAVFAAQLGGACAWPSFDAPIGALG